MRKFSLIILAIMVSLATLFSAVGCAPKSQREIELERYEVLRMSEQKRAALPADVIATVDAYNNKQYYEAAAGFSAILDNPSYRALHQTGRYYLTECFDRLGMSQAAMFELAQILFLGSEGNIYFTASLTKLLALTKETKDESIIFNVLQTIPFDQFPLKFKNELIYMRGKQLFYDGNYEGSLTQFAQVDEKSAFFAKSLYFSGIIQVIRKEYSAAKRTFDKIKDLPETYSDFGEARKVKEMSKLALGQLFYKAGFEAKRDKYAIISKAFDYYDDVDRENDQWFEALFEKTWASALLDHYNTALGTILTLNSPFFAQEFVPETTLVEAITWYRLCKWAEVRDTVQRFKENYEPMARAVAVYLGKNIKTPGAKVYDDMLAQYERRLNDEEAELPLPVLTAALNNDSKFLAVYMAVEELQRELELLEKAPEDFRSNKYMTRFKMQSGKKLTNLKKRGGNMALNTMDRIGKMLKSLLGNANAIDFELTDSERKHLEKIELFGISEAEYRAEKAALEDENYTGAVADGEVYWPFIGEYWKDELGYYYYSVSDECVAAE